MPSDSVGLARFSIGHKAGAETFNSELDVFIAAAADETNRQLLAVLIG